MERIDPRSSAYNAHTRADLTRPDRRRAPVRRRARGSRRRVELLTNAAGIPGIVLVLWLLGQGGVTTRRSLGTLFIVVAVVAVVVWAAGRRSRVRLSSSTYHANVAVQSAGVTVVIYLIGWGPALAVGYGIVMLNGAFRFTSAKATSRGSVGIGADHASAPQVVSQNEPAVSAGGRSLALILWPIVCLGIAQVIVDSLGVRLLVAPRAADGLAAVDSVAVAVVGLFVSRLVAARERAQRELHFAAHHDHLTGLMNRTWFTLQMGERLRREREMARHRGPRAVAVLFCDLVGFKAVNDRFGHEAGDQALVQAAHRMAEALRKGDVLARFAGDEFVVGLCPVAGPEEPVEVAERLMAAFDHPVATGSGWVSLGLSVGVVYSPSGRIGLADLLAQADAAMYEAKAMRRSAWAMAEVA